MNMTMIRTLLIISAVTPAMVMAAVQPIVIKPQRDITSIVVADGEITLLRTVIDLNNAHLAETLHFFKTSAIGPAQQIPIEIKGDYIPVLQLHAGADCAISGAKIFKVGTKLQVVYGVRKGDWSAKTVVKMTVFELTRNDEGAPGTPSLYFAQKNEMMSKSAYCDVNAALDKEAPSLSAERK